MEPARLFPIIVLLSLVTVEYGGWALLMAAALVILAIGLIRHG
jgi:hypothetical protein